MKKVLLTIALALSGINAHAAFEGQAPVTTVEVGGQALLADRNQLTAYIFDVDDDNASNCYNACAKAWPPILVTANENVAAPFGTHTRTDGTLQLTFNSHPIYLFVGDSAPGEINGDGLQGVWHIIPVQ